MLERLLDLPSLLAKKSFFLFGPRATGKSSLITMQLSPTVPIINLLRSNIYLELSADPSQIEAMIRAYPDHKLVVIDEVQRVPMLLNEVHRLIEEEHIKFLLTGSSARKLKQGNANLLAGRAWTAELFPLTSREILNFNLERYLRYGGLPPVYLSDEPEEELNAYVDTYLKEEIQAEAEVRKIPAFSRFLQTSALTSGKMLNFSEIASDTGIPAATIREYYYILEDTFLGFMLPAWTKSIKRKAISTAKFYYFDLGVRNTLCNIHTIDRQSDLYGQAFEHFIIGEVRAYLSYKRLKLPLSYWCSKHGAEVDLLIGDEIAIEIKATNKASQKHYKNLSMLAEETVFKRLILVSHDTINKKYANYEALFWKDFLDQLWQGAII